jgi:hypothetical protein
LEARWDGASYSIKLATSKPSNGRGNFRRLVTTNLTLGQRDFCFQGATSKSLQWNLYVGPFPGGAVGSSRHIMGFNS